MRLFKHGDSLAIVFPESSRQAVGAKEGDEYEFLQIEPGVFLLIRKSNLEGMARQGVVTELSKKLGAQAPAPVQAPAQSNPLAPEKLIETKGYLVIENETDAKALSKALEKRIRDGEFLGVRGFDKKFYILSRSFYLAHSPRALKAIGAKQSSVSELAAILGLAEPACTALLQVMKESGEIIEKRGGLFDTVK